MLHNRSSMLVSYLIAANAVALMLSVFTSQMLEEYWPARLTDLGAVLITIGIGTGQACGLGAYLACSDKLFSIMPILNREPGRFFFVRLDWVWC